MLRAGVLRAGLVRSGLLRAWVLWGLALGRRDRLRGHRAGVGAGLTAVLGAGLTAVLRSRLGWCEVRTGSRLR